MQVPKLTIGKQPNNARLDIGPIVLQFSYSTPIAYYYRGSLVIRENDWGPTTGKHLNAIDPDKSVRIPGEEFEQKLSDLMEAL